MEFEKAVTAFQEAIRLELAQLYEADGFTRQAIEQWKQAKTLQPRPEFSLALGNAYLAMQRYSDAIREYQELLENDPNIDNVRPKCRSFAGRRSRRRSSPGLRRAPFKTVTRVSRPVTRAHSSFSVC